MSGPQGYEEKCLTTQLRNTAILAKTKMEIMQCAVAKYPKVCISAHRIQIPSLFDSGSEVMLLRQSYLDQHILPKIKPEEEPNQVLDKKHQTRLPGIIRWNLIQLSYDVFIWKYGTTGFDSFICPEGVNPLLFSQVCIYHHSNVQKTNTLGATSEVMSQNIKVSKSPKTDDLSKKKTDYILKGRMEPLHRSQLAQKKTLFVLPVIQLLLCQDKSIRFRPN